MYIENLRLYLKSLNPEEYKFFGDMLIEKVIKKKYDNRSKDNERKKLSNFVFNNTKTQSDQLENYLLTIDYVKQEKGGPSALDVLSGDFWKTVTTWHDLMILTLGKRNIAMPDDIRKHLKDITVSDRIKKLFIHSIIFCSDSEISSFRNKLDLFTEFLKIHKQISVQDLIFRNNLIENEINNN